LGKYFYFSDFLSICICSTICFCS